ncbi:hypothetical protein [Actinophytocola sp.]|uniref:hypothetical protein n=1 Tax=Actinophytocola sp. TaxID=1872138 RepID=UPI003D6BA9F8
MHVQRTAVAVSAAIGGVCTFLPWAGVPFLGSVDGTELNGSRGWISLTLCAAVLLGVLLGRIGDPLSGGAVFLCALSGVGIAAIALWTIIEIHVAAQASPFSAGVEVGPYLLVMAGLAIAALATKTTWHPGTRCASASQGGAR